MGTRRVTVIVLASLWILLEIYSIDCQQGECFAVDTCGCRKGFPKCTNAKDGYQCPYTEYVCNKLKFKKGQCRRKNTYMSFHGALCKIKVDKGDCKPEKMVAAVNCGGKEHTDVNGIKYKAYADRPASLPENEKKEIITEEAEVDEFSGAPEEDRPLYGTYIWGDAAKVRDQRAFEICAHWFIPMKEDGNYEITIKTLEPKFDEPLKRSFIFTLNFKYIAIDADIITMTGKKGAVMDIVVPFKISGKQAKIEVAGQEIDDLEDKKLRLAFCHGLCKDDGIENNYVVSAFSVAKVKLGDEDDGDWATDNAAAGNDDNPGGKDGNKGKGKKGKTTTTKATTAKPTKAATKKKKTTTMIPTTEEPDDDAPIGGRSFG